MKRKIYKGSVKELEFQIPHNDSKYFHKTAWDLTKSYQPRRSACKDVRKEEHFGKMKALLPNIF